MLQADEPDDFVLATGRTHSIRDFIVRAADVCGWQIEWSGSAEQEIGTDRKSGKVIVRVNPKFYRPAEVDLLIGSPAKAKEKLGWEPATSFEDLVLMMVEADRRRVIDDTFFF